MKQKKSFSNHSRGVVQGKPPTHCAKRQFYSIITFSVKMGIFREVDDTLFDFLICFRRNSTKRSISYLAKDGVGFLRKLCSGRI